MAESGESQFNIHPMDQFIIKPFFGGDSFHWYTYTNQAFWMTLCFITVLLVFTWGTRRKSVIPDRFQASLEMIYSFVNSMLVDIAGREGLKYFPFVFSFVYLSLSTSLSLFLSVCLSAYFHVWLSGYLAVWLSVSARVRAL